MANLELEAPYGWDDALFQQVMTDVARMLRAQSADERDTNQASIYYTPRRRFHIRVSAIQRTAEQAKDSHTQGFTGRLP